MKNNRTILSITVCLLILTINVFNQTKPITKEEYESVQHIAETNLGKMSYKISTKIEEYSNGNLIKTNLINEETISSKKMRWVSTENSNNKTTKIEIVTIGNDEYKRENASAWMKRDLSKSGFTISGHESPNNKKHTIEETKYNNQSVSIYSIFTVYNFEPNILHTYREWINSDNLILKAETIRSEINSNSITYHEVAMYQYNPKNLKIEAPIK